jgi:hypothetical protein
MLTPQQAHEELQRRKKLGMDDPTEIPSIRWWYNFENVLCHVTWGGTTIRHEGYVNIKVGE